MTSETDCVVEKSREVFGDGDQANEQTKLYLQRQELHFLSCLSMNLSYAPPETKPYEKEVPVDTGAYLELESEETVKSPRHFLYPEKPVVISQGKGQLKLGELGLTAKSATSPKHPGKVFAFINATLATPLDRHQCITSANQLARFGLGTVTMPADSSESRHNRLFNTKGTVETPLYSRANGIPYFKDIGAKHAKKLELYDVYTGKKFNFNLEKTLPTIDCSTVL